MATSELLRVIHIRVVGLFGLYDHDIPLNTDDRVTTIHGPNGVGKTVLLRMVKAALSGNYLGLLKIPFQIFELTLSDGSILGFTKTAHVKDQPGKDDIVATGHLIKAGKVLDHFELNLDRKRLTTLAFRIAREVLWLSTYDDDHYVDERFDELITTFELVSRYFEHLPEETKVGGLFFEPPWMIDIENRVNIHLIEA
jgi:predicted ATP-binding protein involved in virulence